MPLLGTTVGKKAAMAVSGFFLFGFVVAHLAGNLKLYQGAEKMNAYGEFLREVGAPVLGHGQLLWVLRIALLAAAALHLWAAWALTRQARGARPVPYAVRSTVEATYASRTMRWGGVIVLLYVLYHLADLTFGTANPSFVPGRPYENLVASLRRPWVAAFYVAANVALGFHLRHGLWSMFRSLGFAAPPRERARLAFATGFAWLVTLGNLSFPVAVLAGWVR